MSGSAAVLAAAEPMRDQAFSAPLALAVWVAIASINGGDKQSYGSSFSSLSRARTAPMFAGFAPDSMIEETNAANSGGAQPASDESSV